MGEIRPATNRAAIHQKLFKILHDVAIVAGSESGATSACCANGRQTFAEPSDIPQATPR